MKSKIKIMLKKQPLFWKIRSKISQTLGLRKSIRGNNNFIPSSFSIFKKTKITIKGSNNSLVFGEKGYINNSNITIEGNNNKIAIGDKVLFTKMNIHIVNDGNIVNIGKGTTNSGTDIGCIEGKKIIIGDDCMLSSGIKIINGDSHSIVNPKGKRLNISKDINIGNHVWIGYNTIITKGVTINDNSIVGAGSVVTKSFSNPGIVIGGNPARKLNSDITWLRKTI